MRTLVTALRPDAAPGAPLEAALRRRFARLDAAYRASMDAAIEHLRRSGVVARAKSVGDRAPDFALPDRDGASVALSDRLAQGPVVLSFFRGEWCSFCRLELDALLAAQPAIAARGAELVLVSPQGPTEALLARSASRPGLAVLTDPLNGVGLQYGLIFRMPDALRAALLAAGSDLSHLYGSDAWLLPIPATYLVGADGVITLAHIDPDFSRRLEPDAVLHALDAMPRR